MTDLSGHYRTVVMAIVDGRVVPLFGAFANPFCLLSDVVGDSS